MSLGLAEYSYSRVLVCEIYSTQLILIMTSLDVAVRGLGPTEIWIAETRTDSKCHQMFKTISEYLIRTRGLRRVHYSNTSSTICFLVHAT